MFAAEQPDFFTHASLATFGGATLAVVVVTNTMRKAFKITTPIVPLAIALVVAYVVAGVTGALHQALDFLIVFLNGCLLFCTATGAQETVVAGASGDVTGQARSQSAVPFVSSWLRIPG